jgi:Fur family ferric uptake transcriptional regulator
MNTEELLKGFNLRHTPNRAAILHAFISQEYALSHADVEKAVPESFDRVTVYRTLKIFLERGLIHKVLDDEGSLKYALCKEACTSISHHHNHVHFKCTKCGQTSCLSVEVPAVKLPKGYMVNEVNLLLQGICEHCAG